MPLDEQEFEEACRRAIQNSSGHMTVRQWLWLIGVIVGGGFIIRQCKGDGYRIPDDNLEGQYGYVAPLRVSSSNSPRSDM